MEASKTRVVCLGECMIELQGEAFGTMRQTFGGDTLNTAVYLARCGPALRVGYATAVGDDPLSAGLLQRWQAEGVDTELVRRLPGRLPGLYQIAVDARGERHFSYWRNQSAAREYFDAASTPLEDAADGIDLLYLSGISLAILPPAARARVLALAQRLRERGASVAFDNNYRPRLWARADEARAAYDACCAIANIALVTLDDEMALRAEADAERQIARSFALPCTEVIIKRGASSTLLRADNAVHEVPTQPVAQVVDTTAAGDSFAGAYLAARLAGTDPLAAAQAGNRLAAQVIQHRGALIPRDAMTPA